MKINTKTQSNPVFTHEGAKARRVSAEGQLRRSVLSCFLWENEFYEDGQSISARIAELVPKVPAPKVAEIAVFARNSANLRHVPLLLVREMARHESHRMFVADTLAKIIQRADELAEFLAIYWKDGRCPLSSQVKKGLAKAFQKFSEYQLAKYNRDNEIKLRDVMFLCHPKPLDNKQAEVFKKLVDGTLETPDTWEVEISAKGNNRQSWERLLSENKLGYLALLRNLRNMDSVSVNPSLVSEAIRARRGADRVLPFRYVAAARACPRYEPDLDAALVESINEAPALSGRTIILVDVSGSMNAALSTKSDLTRMDAACTLASMIGGDRRVFSFSYAVKEVPPRLGMAGVDAITRSQEHGGTYLGKAIQYINQLEHDRLIVITDEQSADKVPDPVAKKAYMINVASNKNGVGYGRWTHIDGFSESVLKFIHELEK